MKPTFIPRPMIPCLWRSIYFLIVVLIVSSPVVSYSDSKMWQQHRDAARTAIEQKKSSLAEAEFEAALQEAENFGKEDGRLPRTLSEMAHFYSSLRQYEKAQRCCERALNLREMMISLSNLDILVLRTQLGEIYTMEGKYVEAEETLLSAKTSAQRSLGEYHPILSGILSGLGKLALQKQEFSKAAYLFKQSLELTDDVGISASAGGRNAIVEHQKAIAAICNLSGLAALGLKKSKEAEKFFQRTLKILEKQLGKDSPELSTPFSNLVGLYLNIGKYAEAEKYLHRLKDVAEKYAPKEHPIWHDIAAMEKQLNEKQIAGAK